MYCLVSAIAGWLAAFAAMSSTRDCGEPSRNTLFMAVGPPAAWMKLGVAQPEHSAIGIAGFCARIALIAVMVSEPGISPSTMSCGFALSRASACGVSLVAPGVVICLATTWKLPLRAGLAV